MAFNRHDTRTRGPDNYGKTGINYPYGDIRFPRIISELTAKKLTSKSALPSLTPYFDQASYPGAVLIDQTSSKGDATDSDIVHTYEILPGPIFVEVNDFQDTGIPVIVAKRKVASLDDLVEGEIVPTPINVSAIAVSVNGLCTVTLAQNHDLPPRAWVTFAGTNSTPVIDGNQRILAVPAENQIQFAAAVTIAGTAAGTMVGMNRVIREMKTTPNVNILMKIESMIGVPDVTVYNEDIPAWKDYNFPDFLKKITGYRDLATGVGVGTTYSYSFGGGGSFSTAVQHGYRGPCLARRLRIFSMGPPSDAAMGQFTPTFIMPSGGNVVIEQQSFSAAGSSGGSSSTFSASFKSGSLAPFITAAKTVPDAIVGAGQASFTVDLPASQPTHFTAGNIITLVEMPRKLGIGLWDFFAWQIVIPYTSGQLANLRTYTFNGRNGAGNITVTGLLSGDVIASVRQTPSGTNYAFAFTTPIATNNTLAQSDSANLSAFTFVIQVAQ